MSLTWLSDKLAVRGQIRRDEVASIASAGFKGIINNRPDGEAPDQPGSAELEAEARKHGLSYWHIPVVPGQATQSDAGAFAAAVRQSDGPVLAFCRTGNRSKSLWSMVRQES